MPLRKTFFTACYAAVCCAAVCCTTALTLTACTGSGMVSSSSSVQAKDSQSVSQPVTPAQPVYGSDIELQARSLGSSPGRVALAMIICRLDSSYVYTELVKHNADGLFDIVSECAVHKSITLESLNNQYGLTDILASEGIYVTIKANNVTSRPSAVSLTENSGSSASSGSGTASKQSSYGSASASSSKTSESSGAKTSDSKNADTKNAWIKRFEAEIQNPPKA